MYEYAEVNSDGVCVGVSSLSGEVDSPNMIPISEYTETILGKQRVGDSWEETPHSSSWLITVGAFYDRFGTHKLPILASDDSMVKAMVMDSQVRKHIDLQRADLPGMLDILISKGFAVDKTTILETPASVGELP